MATQSMGNRHFRLHLSQICSVEVGDSMFHYDELVQGLMSTLGGEEATVVFSGIASIGGSSVRGHCGEKREWAVNFRSFAFSGNL